MCTGEGCGSAKRIKKGEEKEELLYSMGIDFTRSLKLQMFPFGCF